MLPEVIHALHGAIAQSSVPRTIHLLPAHEHLSTSLRQVCFPRPPEAALPAVHTGFAWLGHGAMLHRSEAVDFLKLMRVLGASHTEMQMADNYYTILSNRVPEVWFDQGIELGGGHPFTVGTEGEERNNRHIVRLPFLPATFTCMRTELFSCSPLLSGPGRLILDCDCCGGDCEFGWRWRVSAVCFPRREVRARCANRAGGM